MDGANMAMLEFLADMRTAYGFEPPLQLSDLYSLAFPDDPIQRHFNSIRAEIETEYQKRMRMLNRIQPEPGKFVEPDTATAEEKALKAVFHTWIELEKMFSVAMAVSYVFLVLMGGAITFTDGVENGMAFLKLLTFGIMPWVIFGGSLIAAASAMFIGKI